MVSKGCIRLIRSGASKISPNLISLRWNLNLNSSCKNRTINVHLFTFDKCAWREYIGACRSADPALVCARGKSMRTPRGRVCTYTRGLGVPTLTCVYCTRYICIRARKVTATGVHAALAPDPRAVEELRSGRILLVH